MTREQHEKIAKTFLEALGRADTDTMSKLSADEMTWWIMPGNKFSGAREYLEKIPHPLDNAAGPLKLEYNEITGEDDRLALVARGDMPMKDGRYYRNNYHFLLRKIVSGKEFMDSMHVNEIFGAP